MPFNQCYYSMVDDALSLIKIIALFCNECKKCKCIITIYSWLYLTKDAVRLIAKYIQIVLVHYQRRIDKVSGHRALVF